MARALIGMPECNVCFTRTLILLVNKTNSIIIIIRFYYKYIYSLSLSLSTLLLVFLVILFGLVFFLSHDGVFVH
jgi:hypothetical protein